MRVRAGDRDLASSFDDIGIQIRRVRGVKIHPRYNFPNAYFDVAVLELAEPLRFDNLVRAVCLPGDTSKNVDSRQGNLVTLTGN